MRDVQDKTLAEKVEHKTLNIILIVFFKCIDTDYAKKSRINGMKCSKLLAVICIRRWDYK